MSVSDNNIKYIIQLTGVGAWDASKKFPGPGKIQVLDIIYLMLLSDTDNLLSVWDNLLSVAIVI